MTRGISKVTQKLISKNGKMLWVPTHMSDASNASLRMSDVDIYEESTSQLFPLGTKLELADGRVFRYGKWGATTARPALGYGLMANANACPSATGYVGDDGFEGNCYVEAAVGDGYVDLWTILGESATGYRTADNPFTKDFFEDGMLAIYPSGHCVEFRICGNDATVTPFTRVYLEEPLKVALTVGTDGAYVTDGVLEGSAGGSGVTAYPSLYSQLKTVGIEGHQYTAAMGVCLTTVTTANSFGWIQRRGRCTVGPTAYFGATADTRVGQAHSNGEMVIRSTYTTQPIGYLTQRTVSGYGDLEVWLTLE